jgi:DEAD/DEAH box helicase domain-containing protein
MNKPIVFDVETQHSFREVGNNTKKLKVSVVAAYDYATNKVNIFSENNINGLFSLFEQSSLIIGYNSNSFDLVVLNEYYVGDLFNLPRFDILEDIRALTNRRYALDDVIKATLNKEKTGHGLLAIELFRQGKIKELSDYCRDDTMLTKELFDYGVNNNFIYVPTVNSKAKVKVNWQKMLNSKANNPTNHNLTLGF